MSVRENTLEWGAKAEEGTSVSERESRVRGTRRVIELMFRLVAFEESLPSFG